MVAAPNTNNNPGFGTFNQQIPKEGPVAVPIGPLDFSTNTTYEIDLTIQIQQGKISYVQGIYADNFDNAHPLTIFNSATKQRIVIPPYSEAYIPFLASNPPKFVVSTNVGGPSALTMFAYNFPAGPCVWTGNPPSSSGAVITVSDTVLDGTVQNNKVTVSDKTVFTALGYQQITSLSAATALTVPSGAIMAIITCETQAVRWRDDGTNPTATVGMPLAAGGYFIYNGALSAIKFIEQTTSAKLNISYYA